MNSIQHEYASNDVGPPKAGVQRALISCALFSSASPATLETVAGASTLEAVSAGKPILQQGSTASSIAVIMRGRARVERSLDSTDVVPLGYRGATDLVGESCLVGAETYTESVIAMGDCDVVRIPMAAATASFKSDPAIALALAALVLERVGEAEDRLTSLLFRPVEGRVVEFLLQAMNRWGVVEPRGTMIAAPITHAEIAHVIGSTRETVTVTLGDLRRDGLLATAGRRLIVVDRDALARRK
jgi:CRP/FNR family cyclic AMP-dependent transcriptional regulator